MRVYEVMAEALYGNGLAIVAAPTPKRALELARAEGRWWLNEADIEARCLRGVTANRKKAKVLSVIYYQE